MNKIKNKIKDLIIEHKVFIELLPIFKKIDFTDMAYDISPISWHPQILSFLIPVGDEENNINTYKLSYFCGEYNLYLDNNCGFMEVENKDNKIPIISTNNIKDIKNILESLYRL